MTKHIKKNILVRIMLAKYGENFLRELWQDMGGATRAAEAISKDMGVWCTSGRFEYLSKIYNWKRKIDADHPIALGVKYGTTKKENYPRIIFPGDNEYE